MTRSTKNRITALADKFSLVGECRRCMWSSIGGGRLQGLQERMWTFFCIWRTVLDAKSGDENAIVSGQHSTGKCIHKGVEDLFLVGWIVRPPIVPAVEGEGRFRDESHRRCGEPAAIGVKGQPPQTFDRFVQHKKCIKQLP